MQNRKKIEKIIEVAGRDFFEDICDFIEEVFTMEADLIILMARKFYCLYNIFQEINHIRFCNLGISYCGKAKVITDRAYPLFAKDIQDGVYKDIVIVDDIVLHGRTVGILYEKIKTICKGTVKVFSLIRNNEKLLYEELERSLCAWYVYGKYEWTKATDDIVRIFYCAGQPYICSVPCFEVKQEEGKELFNVINEEACYNITNEDMEYLEITAKAYDCDQYISSKLKGICKNAFVRVYHYKHLEKYVIVPYVLLLPCEQKTLSRILIFLNCFFSTEYQTLRRKAFGANNYGNGEGELMCREIEYVCSFFLGLEFMRKYNIHGVSDVQLEKYNFGTNIINEKFRNGENGLSDLLEDKEILEVEKDSDNYWMYLPEESKELWKFFDEIAKEYVETIVNDKKDWLGREFNLARDVIGRVLARNGKMDDENCGEKKVKNSSQTKEERERLLGLPVERILSGSQLKAGLRKEELLSAIVSAVDYGKGTIQHKHVKDEKNNYYLMPFLYAGEQNYKYYESRNFPALYAMYLLEKSVKSADLKGKKDEFMIKYIEYMDREGIFYLKTEMEEFEELNVRKDYGRYIAHSAYKYRNNKNLQYAIKCINGMI